MNIDPRQNAVRLISWVDATEPVIEPMALDSLEKLNDTVGPRLSVDMMMERKVLPFGPKLAKGVGQLALLLTAAAAVPGGIACALMGAGPLGLAISAAGAGVVYKKGMNLGFRGLGHIFSAFEGRKRKAPPWSGVRTYEVGRLTGQKPLEKERNLADISDFLARGMKRYPKEDVTVVHLMGHGLGYRQSAGMKQADFDTVLSETVRKAGKPIDVLLLESCLEGNLETVASIGDRARYVVVSEESITAGAMGVRMRNATAHMSYSGPATPSGWATNLVRFQGYGEQPETLALVDTRQLPPVLQALDHLGRLLRQEMEANPDALKAAIQATTTYPKHFPFRGDGRRLGLGDIGHFCRNLQRVYLGKSVTTSFGPFQREARFPDANRSPRARAILDAAVRLREEVDLAVVEHYAAHDYQESSGLSVQLPTSHLRKLDKKLPGFDRSGAPPQWQAFVTEMSCKL